MNRTTCRKIAFACVVLILMLVFVFSGLLLLESAVFSHRDELAEETVESKTIVKDGVEYFPRQDITVVMVLGIGERGTAEPAEWNNACAVDMINLLIFDEKNQEAKILTLNRDTMLWMPKYTPSQKLQGSAYRQLTYSHKFCTGMEDSCENVRETVSDFLGGITIDYYVSMRLDAVSIMNDSVGGVTVTVRDDFSAVDSSIPMGEYTLKGEQAVSYVQSRHHVGDEMNLSRIERQKEYVRAFLSAFRDTVKSTDVNFVVDTYNRVAPYLVSDLPISTLTGMVERYIDYSLAGFFAPEGENKLGEKYYEFYADEEKLEDLRLELFYAPK